ncbi:MAG: hypothetical protein GQ542_19440 [Desulforhopalus sp.]|jgi:hydrogenase maturation factor|nr:hypothetical protein [Desulforhopalus sp.]
MFDLTDVHFVKRITIGTSDPSKILSEEEVQQTMDLLNKCLNGPPKGTIVGIEKSFKILNIGEHQAVLQWLVYHVGFPRKPAWLED